MSIHTQRCTRSIKIIVKYVREKFQVVKHTELLLPACIIHVILFSKSCQVQYGNGFYGIDYNVWLLSGIVFCMYFSIASVFPVPKLRLPMR